jgi:hypothetical protein
MSKTTFYYEYFQDVIVDHPEAYVLTPKGFNSVSQIPVSSFIGYLQMPWYDFVERHEQIDRLLEYARQEYKEFIKHNKTGSIHKFISQHEYLTETFLEYVGIEEFYKGL